MDFDILAPHYVILDRASAQFRNVNNAAVTSNFSKDFALVTNVGFPSTLSRCALNQSRVVEQYDDSKHVTIPLLPTRASPRKEERR